MLPKKPQLPYRDRTTLEERIQLVNNQLKGTVDSAVVVLSRHPKCTLYDFIEIKVKLQLTLKLFELDNHLRKQLLLKNSKFEKSSLFIFVGNRTLGGNRQLSLREIYDKYANKEDGILYIEFASVESF